MASDSPIFVTCALPYANGPIHLGHLLEHIQADIWVRFQKMQGQSCFLLCADDAHGTPVMLKAQQLNQPVEQMIFDIQQAHIHSFKLFLIDHDIYHSTHSKENKKWVYRVYETLLKKELIKTQTISQLYDPIKKMFLPDRYVKGMCPKCGALEQYGDGCEKCGAVYGSDDLLNPVSSISGAVPEKRDTTHQFFALSKSQSWLENYLANLGLENAVFHKLKEWFTTTLRDWDISRDAPYFGFLVPDTQDQYFYVWLDAPLGYFAALEKLCQAQSMVVEDYLGGRNPCQLYHFIGKDIMYFHGLFWPAILHCAGLKLPDNLFVHGFLNVGGQKMSKSRGTFIEADDYIKHLPPESLRYFLASRLTKNTSDLNLDFLELKQKFNSDLVGKVVNIASRSAKFVHRYFEGRVTADVEPSILKAFHERKPKIFRAYQAREFAQAVKHIMHLADLVNSYIAEYAPWQAVKTTGADETVHRVCNTAIQTFRYLVLFLKPILPTFAHDAEQFLSIEPLCWIDADVLLEEHLILEFKPLLSRITDQQIAIFIQ